MMRNWIRPALVVTALVSATAVRAADGGPSILSVGSNLSDRFGPGPFALRRRAHRPLGARAVGLYEKIELRVQPEGDVLEPL